MSGRRRAGLLAALLLLLFVADAVLIHAGYMQGLDDAWLRFGRKADARHGFGGGPGLLDLVLALTELGGALVRTPLTIVAVLALALLRRGREAILLAATVASGAAAMALIKQLVARARPDPAWRLIEVLHPSFPSGHAMGSMILYPLLGLTIGHATGASRRWVAAGIALALAIGATRVLLGVHWASDVLGGWLIGGAWAFAAAACAHVRGRPCGRLRRRPPRG